MHNLVDTPGRIEGCAGVLRVTLAQWARRDDSQAQPEIRQAATTAMAAIDTMLAELHQARAALLTEIRTSDDAAMERTAAMLAVPLAERLACRMAAAS
jgi:hypothetical protein